MIRSGSSLLVAAALGLASAGPLWAQADVIRGRVTSAADGQPIYGAVVTATSISGNVSRNARTNTDGRYTITFPGGDGDYWMTVAAVGFTPRRFELKRLADEAVLVADTRLSVLQLDTLQVTAGRRRPGRNDPERDVSGTDRSVNPSLVAPDQLGDLAAMAASQPGVNLIPGTNGDPSGFSVLGLSTDQNVTNLNGMSSGATDLPRDAGVSVSVATSPYDVSQGGFSGGALNVRTFPGSNYLVQTLSAIGDMPQLQWTDRVGRSLNQEYTNLSLGGAFAGPLAFDKAFYNLSWQAGRRANDLATLLNTDPLGLQTQGVAADSVSRLLGILTSEGIPATVAGFPDSRHTDQGSLLGSFDFMPPSSTSGQSFNLTVNGSWARSSPGQPVTTQLPSSTFRFTNWSGSARLRHTAYLGFLLTETGVSFGRARRWLSPYMVQPSGSVLVQSDFDGGTSGVQLIQFGGNSARSTNETTQWGVTNQLSWFSGSNRHRVRLTSELRRERWSLEQATNLLGSFAFNSLADLENDAPASFRRQLAPVAASGAAVIGALALGDSYRPHPDVQIVYGLRMDATRFDGRPAANPAIQQAFGAANDYAPNGVWFSPRLGFSWVYGTAPQIGAFTGAARVPRGTVRGGIGVFQNTPAPQLLAQAMTTTGLAGGVQQITCVGPAAPTPDWSAYQADADSIPTQCEGAAPPALASAAPNVALIAPGWAPARSIRSNLQWSRPVLDNRLMATVTGTFSYNQRQAGIRDLNFDPTVEFTLPGEAGRPVFVRPASIVAATGAVSARDSRVDSAFNFVNALTSDFRSVSRQLQLQIAPLAVNSRFSWGLAYTLGSVRDRISGFGSTAGSPLAVTEARSQSDWRHQIQLNLGVNLFDLIRVSWFQRIQSGVPYTPVVSGDINGDGFANDRAFVADPAATADTALANGMNRLLGASASRVRDCLTSQLGRIAGRSSCEGPWTTTGFLTLAFNPIKIRMPQRATLSLQVANPLGALDLVLNGQDNLRGWGQAPTPDTRLLVVRGFDSTTQRYRYEVNQRFGSTSQSVSAVRNPVALTLSLRFDLGPARERQALTQTLDRGRTRTGTKMPEPFLRTMYGSGGIMNPLAAILSQADSLQLTGVQADSLAMLNRWYVVRLDSIWRPVIRGFVNLPDRYDHNEVYRTYRRSREATVDLLLRLAPDIKGLLTASQQRRLPPLVAGYLDQRYLAAIRTGTSGAPGGVFAPGAGVPGAGMMGGGGTQVIIRQ